MDPSAIGPEGRTPSYDTYRDNLHREIYSFAQKAYAAVEIPPQIQRPKTN